MHPRQNILVVDTGSTSTKVGIYSEGAIVDSETINHPVSELSRFPAVWDQFPFRNGLCLQWFTTRVRECRAIGAIGGLLRSLPGGSYRVNDEMIRDARANLQGEHASNLGCAIASELSKHFRCPAFVVDPVSVDEFEPLARYSGHPLIPRRSLSHALNIHAVVRRACAERGIPVERSRMIVCHLGGGISIAPVLGNRIIDVNDAASDGPFSPERTGGLPLQSFITLCYSGKYSMKEMRSLVMGSGGLVSYLGMNSAEAIGERIAGGDTTAAEVMEAMAYQIAKEIGAMATVLRGTVDTIILTGGLARSDFLTRWIRERVEFIAPVVVYPGDDELGSIAEGVLRVLEGKEQPLSY